MRAKSYSTCSACRIVLIAATLAVGACDAVNDAVGAINDVGNDAEVHYYVSLGTSLSVGVQPNGSGVLLPTDNGYADQLFDRIRPAFDAAGQALAMESALTVAVATDVLGTTYATAGMPVADVADEFDSDNFTTMVASSQPSPNEVLPVSVNNICELTYMCDVAVGPDIHANTAGYSRIADAFEAELP